MSSAARRFQDWEIGTINSDGVPIRSDGKTMSHAELVRPTPSQIDDALDVSCGRVSLTIRRFSVLVRVVPEHSGFVWSYADMNRVNRRSSDGLSASHSSNLVPFNPGHC